MRCARATRRSAAVAAARCRPLHRQPLCLDGFTAIHRRDYYPPGCLPCASPVYHRPTCTQHLPPLPSLSLSLSSRSIRPSSPFPLSVTLLPRPPRPPNLYRPRFSFALSGISLRRLGAMDGRETTTTTLTHANDTRHILLGAEPNSTPERTPTLISPLREPNFRLQPRHYRDALSLEIRYYSSGRPRFNRASVKTWPRVYPIGEGGRGWEIDRPSFFPDLSTVILAT